ncbi:MAG: hypothetical protein JWO19_3166 [Bryobacterales bacterium]|nr:hypothetical protein [Bryobacterales bacterium]
MNAAKPASSWQLWMRSDEAHDARHARKHATHPWYLVIWLTGVDYFSTLGYQPGIALLAAGALAPVATAVLVAVTLLCALPVYVQVAGRSHAGLGSIAMLENLLPGWWGKFMVLVLLGFAMTDFVITMTLSASDAARHATENPYLHPLLGDAHLRITLVLLALLAAVFLKGFTEAIELATLVCVPYLVLNVVVLGRALMVVTSHPTLVLQWENALRAQGDWKHLALSAIILFPRLALGLSGFETGVSVMPLIRCAETDSNEINVQDRIRNTRKLLATAAVIMSLLLLVSSFVSVLLIPKEVYQEGGPASGRAIAYLAHEYLGNVFGSIYDLSTILVLWFAGASAMAGLLHLVPRYLPRIGLAPEWVAYARPLVLMLFGCNVVVTLIFRANVEAQAGAYATGVLVLMLSASLAAAISLWKEHSYALSIYCWGVAVVFAYTTAANVIERRDGIIIAGFFILFILIVSGVSRYWRSRELRVGGHRFRDPESERLWNKLTAEADRKVNMVPVGRPDLQARAARAAQLRKYYKVEGLLVFVHVRLLDNRSEFLSPLEITVTEEADHYLVQALQAVAKANAVAYLSQLLNPATIYLGLSRQNLMRQSFRYFLLGEGETGLMVYTILLHLWEGTPWEDQRPCLFLMSD